MEKTNNQHLIIKLIWIIIILSCLFGCSSRWSYFENGASFAVKDEKNGNLYLSLQKLPSGNKEAFFQKDGLDSITNPCSGNAQIKFQFSKSSEYFDSSKFYTSSQLGALNLFSCDNILFYDSNWQFLSEDSILIFDHHFNLAHGFPKTKLDSLFSFEGEILMKESDGDTRFLIDKSNLGPEDTIMIVLDRNRHYFQDNLIRNSQITIEFKNDSLVVMMRSDSSSNNVTFLRYEKKSPYKWQISRYQALKSFFEKGGVYCAD